MRRLRMLLTISSLLVSALSAQEEAKPLTRQQVMGVLDVLKGDAADSVIAKIQRQGVNFQMTAADEQDLSLAGASPSLLAVIGQSYRQPGPAPITSGPALGKDELMMLLQNGVTGDRLEALVAARGVNFEATPTVEQDFAQAGAGERLIRLMKLRNMPTANAAAAQPHWPAPPPPQAPWSQSALPVSASSTQQLPQQQTEAQPAVPHNGCIALKSIGSHALRNIMLAGVAGALVSKQQYQVVDAITYPVRIGKKFHGDELQTIQAGGTKVVILDKHYSGDDLGKACR